MSQINHFKILLFYEMIWQMMLDEWWFDMIWLDTDVNNLHVKIIDLNKP
jgi:hypothetical protein